MRYLILFLFPIFIGCNKEPAKIVSNSEFNSELLTKHNEERKKKNLPLLSLDPKLNENAEKWAEFMSNKNRLKHSELSFFNIVGENIAAGQDSIEQVMKDWMDSPGHKQNILNPKFTHVGFGHHNRYWCVQFGGK